MPRWARVVRLSDAAHFRVEFLRSHFRRRGASSRRRSGLTLVEEGPPRVGGFADGPFEGLRARGQAVQGVSGPFGVAEVDFSVVRPERYGVLAKAVMRPKPFGLAPCSRGGLALMGEDPSQPVPGAEGYQFVVRAEQVGHSGRRPRL